MSMLQKSGHNSRTPARWAKLGILLLWFGAAPHSTAAEWIYTVRPGDNLWNISSTYLTDMRYWQKLQALNDVKNPNRMPPGLPLRIPVPWLKVQPASVRVLYVQGNANVQRSTGPRDHVTPGMQLVMGDTLLTEANASATLEFADGSRLLVQEHSQLIFDTLSAYGKTGMVDTRIRLMSGRVESQVKPVQTPAGRFEVWTPAATSAVRGTRFRAAIGGSDGLARAEVTEGDIDVIASGTTTVVNTGFGTVVKQGQPPPPPRPLLPAPTLNQLPDVITTAAAHFTLPALAGAVSYRVQLTHAERPDAPLWDRIYPGIEIDNIVLNEGSYLLKVRGIDDAGLEGMDAVHAFAVEILPAAPTELQPGPDAHLGTGRVQFQWQRTSAAASYVFQLARTADFAQPLFNIQDITTTSWQPEHELTTGVYFWHMASVDHNGKRGEFGPAQRLLIIEEPARLPYVAAVTTSTHTVRVYWPAVAAVPHYEIQLAYDAAFEDTHTVLRVHATEAQLPHPRVDSYYLRLRYLNEAGQPGPYGPTYHVPVSNDVVAIFGLTTLIFGLVGL